MFFWLWKLNVIKQGPDPSPNVQSIKLPTRNASLRPKTKQTRCFSLLFGRPGARGCGWPVAWLGLVLGPCLWLHF